MTRYPKQGISETKKSQHSFHCPDCQYRSWPESAELGGRACWMNVLSSSMSLSIIFIASSRTWSSFSRLILAVWIRVPLTFATGIRCICWCLAALHCNDRRDGLLVSGRFSLELMVKLLPWERLLMRIFDGDAWKNTLQFFCECRVKIVGRWSQTSRQIERSSGYRSEREFYAFPINAA